MIITISGAPGSGKTTIAEELARVLGYKHYSNGDYMRQMAVNRGMTLNDLTILAMNDASIDHEIDAQSKKLVERAEDDFVIDARLGYHFIPNSFKVYLSVSEEEAARRIFQKQREHESKRKYVDEEEAHAFIRKRMASEVQRYQSSYGLRCHDTEASGYDIILDTTELSPDEVVEHLLRAIEAFK